MAAGWLLLCLAGAASALQPDKAFPDYVADTWGVEHGLPQISVLAITQDRDGYIWLGSQGGLARYDGVGFTRYGQQNAAWLGGHVLALYAGKDGRLWIGTSQGLLLYRGGRFTEVPATRPDQAQGTFPVRAIIGDGDGVLVGGPDGVYASDGTRLSLRHPLGGPVLSLLRHDDGLWAGSTGQVFRIGERMPSARPLPADAAQEQVSRLVQDRTGALWAGTAAGLYRLRMDAWTRIASTPVEALLADSDGNLWVGSPQRLDRLGEDGRRLESVSDQAGARAIRSIYEDRDGNLWLGSMVDGVTRLWDGWTTRLGRAHGLSAALLWSIARGPDGSVWVGGSDGVDIYRDGRFHSRVAGERLPHPEAYSLLVERGQVWIGTRAGPAVLRRGRVQTPAVLAPMRGAQVNGIVRDHAGRLWFATLQGLYLLWPDGSLSQYGQAQGLPDPRVRLVHETRDGRLLIGTHDGLYEWRAGAIVAVGRETGFDNDTTVSAIHELDDGRWIVGSTTGQELRLFDGHRWTRLGQAQGIPANIPFFITHARGYLWVAGMRGVYRVPLRELDRQHEAPPHPLAAEIVINSGADRPGGQPDKCCNGAGNSRGLLLGDTLWLPTREGALLLDTAWARPAGTDPSVLVERVQALGQWHYPSGGRAMRLPLGARDLKFEFAAPAFQPMRPPHLRFRLNGYDRDWRELDAPHLRNATYTNLPPGDYSFEVANANAASPTTRATVLPFSIPPRWHETLAFRLLLPLLAGLVVYLLYEWLQHRHTRQRAALERLVQERTRDLQAANARLEALSFTDPLTGLHNRRYLSRQIPADLAFYERDLAYQGGTEAMVLALLDVDHFKAINDTYGHTAGDRILEQLGVLLTALVRKGDYAVRWGGEEFLLVFRPLPRGSVPRIGARLCEDIRNHAFELSDGSTHRLTASVGLVEHPLFPGTPNLLGWEQMVTLADRALYRAKSAGRDTWAAFRPRAGAQPPSSAPSFEGDPSWLVDAGLVEPFGAEDRATAVIPR